MVSPTNKIVWQSTYLQIYHDTETNIIHADWVGYVTVNQVKEGCEQILKYIIQYNSKILLNDNRQIKGSWTQALPWLGDDFFPRLVQNNIKKIAYLYSPDKGAQYSVNRLLELNDQYQGQSFDDYKNAYEWLTNLPATSESNQKQNLLIKTKKGHTPIPINDILYITTLNRKSMIQTLNSDYQINTSLSDLLDNLPQPQFFRIHKSYIVNTEKIKHLKYHAGGYYHLYLKNYGNVYLTVSRLYVKNLKEALNIVSD